MSAIDDLKKQLAHDTYYNLGNDEDHHCPECGSILQYVFKDTFGRDLPNGDGYWKCSNCTFVLGEYEVQMTDPGEYDPDEDILRDNFI